MSTPNPSTTAHGPSQVNSFNKVVVTASRVETIMVEGIKLRAESALVVEEISLIVNTGLIEPLTAVPMSDARARVDAEYLGSLQMQLIVMTNRLKELADEMGNIVAEAKQAGAELMTKMKEEEAKEGDA